jgi:hypothetical protein
MLLISKKNQVMKAILNLNLFACLMLCLAFEAPIHAQQTVEEWVEAAETAAAEGRTTDAGGAYSAAGELLLKNGDPAGAAEYFKKAAEKFEEDGRTAQAGVERVNAATSYERAAEKASEDGDHERAAELYEKAAEQYDADDLTAMAEGARRKAENERAQPVSISITATGNTGGMVATVTAVNTTNNAQTATIPAGTIASDGKSQGLVIPDAIVLQVPAHGTATASLTGYCMQPSLPPPAEGTTMGIPKITPETSSLITTTKRIISETTKLINNGHVTTPFNPGKANDILIQYAVWTAVPEAPISPVDLCERITMDFETMNGKPVSALTPEDRKVFDYGVLQIVDAIEKIGKGAGIPAFTPAPLPVIPVADALPSTHPEIARTIRVTSTERTTGHFADMYLRNPTSRPVAVKIGDGRMYIPGKGKQPFAADEIPPITLQPGEEKTVPLYGYCADIRIPPEAAGGDMLTPKDWISSGMSSMPVIPDGYDLVTIPTRMAPPLQEVISRLKDTYGSTAITADIPCPDGALTPTPFIPTTTTRIPTPVTVNQNPGVAVALILDAFRDISATYLEREAAGLVKTPFSTDPKKNEMTIIQNGLWIYESALSGTPFRKEDFRATTAKEFQRNMGKSVEQLPEPQKEELEAGVDDFWNAFTGVVKLVPEVPELPEPSRAMEEGWDRFHPGQIKEPLQDEAIPVTPSEPGQAFDIPDEPPVLIADIKPGKYCECGEISFELQVWDVEATGPNSWRGVQGSMIRKEIKVSSAPGEPEHVVNFDKDKLDKGTRQLIALKSIEKECPCVNITNQIIEAIKALEKLERSNRSKIENAKEALAKAKTKLEEEKNKRRPRETTIERLTNEIAELEQKIRELEEPILAKQKEIDDLKKEAHDSDCNTYENEEKKLGRPTINVSGNGSSIQGTWGNNPFVADYSFMHIKGNDPMECIITISFYCSSENECKPVSCTRTIKVIIEKN